jgi:hypothetical protein
MGARRGEGVFAGQAGQQGNFRHLLLLLTNKQLTIFLYVIAIKSLFQ